MSRRIVVAVFVALGGLLPLGGCTHRLPPIVPVQGTVLINGKPLPKASVTFMPQLDHFGAESNSTAETDEDGKFTLTCAFNSQPGAVVGKHVVLVSEAALPAELRRAQDGRIDQYRAKLGNRPIPAEYSSVTQSPLRIEVKEGQEPLTLELAR